MIRRVLLAVALLLSPHAAAQPTEPGAADTAGTAEAATPASSVAAPSLRRFGPTLGTPQPEPKRFGVNAAAGTRLSYVQVQSTVLELGELEVSGLGNAGNAALKQRLRAALLAPDGLTTLGESASRRLSLSVSSKTPTGTELVTQWQDTSGADITLTQTLLAGANPAADAALPAAGLVQVSSSDPVLAAQLRAALPYSPRDLSLGLDAPYGLSLREGESQSRQARRNMQPLLSGLTALLGRALGSDLPAPIGSAPIGSAPTSSALTDATPTSSAPMNLRPLLTTRDTLFQGRNSRGNLLFQVQGQQVQGKQEQQDGSGPWVAEWSGALGGSNALTSTPARLRAEVPTVSEFAQAIYRPDGLPDSAFEFGTLTLRLEVQAGGANVRVSLQLRRTLALRPVGN